MKALKIITFILVAIYILLLYIGKKAKITLYKGEVVTNKSTKEKVKNHQETLNDWFIKKGFNDRLKIDGLYGKLTKGATTLVHGSEPTSTEQIQEYVDNL